MAFDIELLNWVSNFLNALIFAFISINIINTLCFDIFQMSLSLLGLIGSMSVQMIALVLGQGNKRRNKR